jgi:hypothetical protein
VRWRGSFGVLLLLVVVEKNKVFKVIGFSRGMNGIAVPLRKVVKLAE